MWNAKVIDCSQTHSNSASTSIAVVCKWISSNNSGHRPLPLIELPILLTFCPIQHVYWYLYQFHACDHHKTPQGNVGQQQDVLWGTTWLILSREWGWYNPSKADLAFLHDNVMTWECFPLHWPFVLGIHYHRWYFLWSQHEHDFEQTVELQVL